MIKLKKLLKESYVWDRKFGEKLPTLADVEKKYKKMLDEASKYDTIKAKMVDTMGLLVKKMGLKSVKKHLVGKGGMSFFLDDGKEAQKLQKYLKSKIKDVSIINLDKKGGDETNFVVYAKVFDF